MTIPPDVAERGDGHESGDDHVTRPIEIVAEAAIWAVIDDTAFPPALDFPPALAFVPPALDLTDLSPSRPASVAEQLPYLEPVSAPGVRARRDTPGSGRASVAATPAPPDLTQFDVWLHPLLEAAAASGINDHDFAVVADAFVADPLRFVFDSGLGSILRRAATATMHPWFREFMAANVSPSLPDGVVVCSLGELSDLEWSALDRAVGTGDEAALIRSWVATNPTDIAATVTRRADDGAPTAGDPGSRIDCEGVAALCLQRLSHLLSNERFPRLSDEAIVLLLRVLGSKQDVAFEAVRRTRLQPARATSPTR